MKKSNILIVVLFIMTSSFKQLEKTNCTIDAILNSNLLCDKKQQQNKWNETIFKLKSSLNSKNTNHKKIEIRNDTLQLAEKISVKAKAQYNITKFPLKRLVDVTFSFRELVIYTKRKEVLVKRFQFKKLNTSQLTLFKKIKKQEGNMLKKLFQQLIAINNVANSSD